MFELTEMAVPGDHSSEDEGNPLVLRKTVNNDDENGVPDYTGRNPISWGRISSFEEISEHISHHFGTIGYLGSMSIAVNSLTGPAMVNLPDTYLRSGFIPTTITLIFVSILSALCCLHMSNTISKVSGNSNFKREIEYSETFEKFWGHKSFLLTQALFFCCVTCLNISSIIDTSQVVDTVLGHWVRGGSVALNLFWANGQINAEIVRWDYSSCPEEMLESGECIPFHEDQGWYCTLGYLITLLVFIPMALMDLKVSCVRWIVFLS